MSTHTQIYMHTNIYAYILLVVTSSYIVIKLSLKKKDVCTPPSSFTFEYIRTTLKFIRTIKTSLSFNIESTQSTQLRLSDACFIVG